MPGSPRPWLDVLAVAVVQALLLQGVSAHVDLHPADEVGYQRQGQRLLAGVIDRDSLVLAPVYSAAYALLQLLPLRGAVAQDAMGVTVVFASSLALWWALRPLLPRVATLLASLWWSASLLVLANPLRVYSFTAVLTTLAVGLAARGRSSRALGMLALATLNRPELMPWLLAASAGCGVWAWRRRERSRVVGALLALVACAALASWLGRPEARQRAWFTFRWDYAAHFAPGDDVSLDENANVTRADALVAQAFPACRSVGAALATNPQAVLGHVGRNLRLLPGNLLDLVSQSFFHRPLWRAAALAMAGLAFAAGVVLWWRERWGGAAGARARRGWPAPALIVLGSSVAVLGPLTLFLPRPDYLMPLATPLLFALALGIARGGGAVCARLGIGAQRAAWLGLAGVLIVTAVLRAPFVWPPAAPRANRDAVALLGRHDFPAAARVHATGAGELLLLAGRAARPAPITELLPGARQAPADAPSFVLLGPWDLAAPYAGWIVAELASERWDLIDARSECWLFRRRP